MNIKQFNSQFIEINQNCTGNTVTLLLIVGIGIILRFVDLKSWPVFIDEDNYTSIVHQMGTVPLSDAIMLSTHVGKPPLFFLIQRIFLTVLGDDVLAGRLPSAAAGTSLILLTFFLGRRLEGVRVGLIAAAIYAVNPLAVMTERMILLDGPSSAFSLAAILLAWVGLDRRSNSPAIWASILGALSVLFKVPGVATAFIPFVPAFVIPGPRAQRLRIAVIAAIGPVITYGLLTRNAGIVEQNAARGVSPSVAQFLGNGRDLIDTMITYFPSGLLLLAVIGIVWAVSTHPRIAVIFLAAIAVWSLPWLVISNFAPSRYYLAAIPYIASFAAFAIVQAMKQASRGRWWSKALLSSAFLGVFLVSLTASIRMIGDIRFARLSTLDDLQYRSSWPSGVGYAMAGMFVSASAPAGSSVAYVIDPQHRVAAGFYRPLPNGIRSLGLFKVNSFSEALHATDSARGVFVLVDDDPNDPSGKAAGRLQSADPRFQLQARFPGPEARHIVYVLWLPPQEDDSAR